MISTIGIDSIQDENLTYSDDDLYSITSWGADFSFREILSMYDEGDLLKPELQRKYVWTKNEASRFIDSILLGLPVPSIFFAKEANETMLIVDGYQRIMTIYDFYHGIFSGDQKVFKLSNSEIINERWRGKAYIELTPEEQRKIKVTTIHAIIFEQKQPQDNTGMYQIFERINTGGKPLKPQEIRNCIYQGSLNTLLFEINGNDNWRTILNTKTVDSRMLDLELILRFFAMNELHNRHEVTLSQINLQKYLNIYMGENKNIDTEEQQKMKDLFNAVMLKIFELLGDNAFKNLKRGTDCFSNKINPAIFDAVSIATAFALKNNICTNSDSKIKEYIDLLNDPDFSDACSRRTTNITSIQTRINLATNYLFGAKYEW